MVRYLLSDIFWYECLVSLNVKMSILYLSVSYDVNILCFERLWKKSGYFAFDKETSQFYFVLFYKEVSDNLVSFSREGRKSFSTTFLIHSSSGDTKGFIF